MWKNSTPKINHETLFSGYKDLKKLKNIDISSKTTRLQCPWTTVLYENLFDEWKLILLYLIKKSFGSSLNFIQSNFLKEIKS